MPDSKSRRPVPVADDAVDDDEAPLSDARPSSPPPEEGLLARRAPSKVPDAPLPPDITPVRLDDASSSYNAGGVAVTRALTSAFLAKKATQERIREVVEYRVPLATQKSDVMDLIQEANLHAMATTSLATSVTRMRAWISRIAQNVVIDHFRSQVTHLKWLDRSVDVQDLPPDVAIEDDEGELPPDAGPPRPMESVDGRMLARWLETQVKTRADRLTLEMLRQKAATAKTNAEIAAEYGITEGAFDQRLRRFRAQWVPKWKTHQKEKKDWAFMLLAMFVVLLVGAVVWWLLHRPPRTEPIGPDPVPTVSASAAHPERMNQALPHEEPPTGKPR